MACGGVLGGAGVAGVVLTLSLGEAILPLTEPGISSSGVKDVYLHDLAIQRYVPSPRACVIISEVLEYLLASAVTAPFF